MSLPANFAAKLPQQSSEDLFLMLEHATDYLPEAVDSMRSELSRRDLASEQAEHMRIYARDVRASEEARINAPLEWPMRVFCLVGVMLLFMGAVPFITGVAAFFWIVGYYNATRQKRKARECGLWLLCTVIVCVFLIFCVIALVFLALATS